MKTKFISVTFFTVFIALFGQNTFAVWCKADWFCRQQGVLNNINEAEEEFQMLLEPTYHPNFTEVFGKVLSIFGCAEDTVECGDECMATFKDPNCNISQYTQRLLEFYEANKMKLIKNIKNSDPNIMLMLGTGKNENLTITQLFERFKKRLGYEYSHKDVDFFEKEL